MTSYKDKDVIVVEEKCNIYTVCQMEYGLFKIIMDYLNVRELLMVKESCFTKQLSQHNNNLLYWTYGKQLIINTKMHNSLNRRANASRLGIYESGGAVT